MMLCSRHLWWKERRTYTQRAGAKKGGRRKKRTYEISLLKRKRYDDYQLHITHTCTGHRHTDTHTRNTFVLCSSFFNACLPNVICFSLFFVYLLVSFPYFLDFQFYCEFEYSFAMHTIFIAFILNQLNGQTVYVTLCMFDCEERIVQTCSVECPPHNFLQTNRTFNVIAWKNEDLMEQRKKWMIKEKKEK